MSTAIGVPTSKPLWRSSFWLAIYAAIFTAIFKVMDSTTLHNLIVVEKDPLTATMAYLMVGSIVGLMVAYVCAPIFGARIVDSKFKKITMSTPTVHKTALRTGGLAAISTFFLLWGNQINDPSAVVPLASAAVLYTALYEYVRGDLNGKKGVILVAGMIMLGVACASYSGSLQITLLGFVLVALLSAGFDAVSQVTEGDGARETDGVTFFFWRFFYLTVTANIFAVALTAMRGQLPLLWATIQGSSWYVWSFIVATMVVVFVAIGLRIVAKKEADASIVVSLMTVQVLLVYPLTWFGDKLIPDLFGELVTDPTIWAVRIMGAILIFAGVVVISRWYKKD